MSNEQLFNQTWEEFLVWNIDTGIFYLSGRDIACVIVGFGICLILWAMFDGKEINVRRDDN